MAMCMAAVAAVAAAVAAAETALAFAVRRRVRLVEISKGCVGSSMCSMCSIGTQAGDKQCRPAGECSSGVVIQLPLKQDS